MARTKKPVSLKRKPAARGRSQPAHGMTRFLRAFVVSSLASFGAATYLLNPQWRIPVTVEDVLARLQWPPREQAAPVAVPTGATIQTRFATCPQFFPGGYPPAVPAGPALREVCFSNFAVLHNGRTRTPVFVEIGRAHV